MKFSYIASCKKSPLIHNLLVNYWGLCQRCLFSSFWATCLYRLQWIKQACGHFSSPDYHLKFRKAVFYWYAMLVKPRWRVTGILGPCHVSSLESAELTCKREAEREWESVSCMPPLTPQGSSNSEQEQAWATLPQMTETLQVLSIQNGAPGFYSMESVFITLYSFYWDWIFSTEGCEGKREAFNLNLPIFSDMFWSLSGSE